MPDLILTLLFEDRSPVSGAIYLGLRVVIYQTETAVLNRLTNPTSRSQSAREGLSS